MLEALSNILLQKKAIYNLLRSNFVCTVLCNVLYKATTCCENDKIFDAIGNCFRTIMLLDFK